MAGVNKIILLGRLGKDPESKTTQTGAEVCTFSLATSEKWNGEERTEWHQCVAYNKLAEIAGKYLSKGKQVYLEGRIQTRKWQDGKGNDHYQTEVIVGSLTMLGGASER